MHDFSAMRKLLMIVLGLTMLPSWAQKRDRFTLYDEHSGKPHRIKEGKRVDISLLPDRCAGWEERSQTVSGKLLLVEDSSITILYDGENLYCSQGDSSFTWNNWDVDEGTSRTIPNNKIFWLEKQQPTAGTVFAGISGMAFMTAVFIAPLASIKWFNGWDFNADTYTSIAGTSLVVAGASLPLAGVFGSYRRLVPKGHARRNIRFAPAVKFAAPSTGRWQRLTRSANT